ncbi:hypothetical protein EYF80_019341 [Liparis tanakae]|uniref:Uncharacterized protein n=1 Tax=Liparis tanakae TaxID=230148 RepID=A0A4Z2HZM4_9TELE|nr:hypothetical protein EYF80_019341 [Liparis tanakae]
MYSGLSILFNFAAKLTEVEVTFVSFDLIDGSTIEQLEAVNGLSTRCAAQDNQHPSRHASLDKLVNVCEWSDGPDSCSCVTSDCLPFTQV